MKIFCNSKDNYLNSYEAISDNDFVNIVEYLSESRKRLVFEDKNGEVMLFANDIIVVEIFGRDVQITLTDKKIECIGPLQKYEKSLAEYGFIQIARGIYVNKKYNMIYWEN